MWYRLTGDFLAIYRQDAALVETGTVVSWPLDSYTEKVLDTKRPVREAVLTLESL